MFFFNFIILFHILNSKFEIIYLNFCYFSLFQMEFLLFHNSRMTWDVRKLYATSNQKPCFA